MRTVRNDSSVLISCYKQVTRAVDGREGRRLLSLLLLTSQTFRRACLGAGAPPLCGPRGTGSTHGQQGEKRQLLVGWTSDCSPQTQMTLLPLHSVFILIEMFSFWSTFTLKHVETRMVFKMEEGKMIKQLTTHVTSPPRSSMHCAFTLQGFSSGFLQFLSVLHPLV